MGLRKGSGKEKASGKKKIAMRLVGANCEALRTPTFIIPRWGSGKEKARHHPSMGLEAIVRLVGAEGLEPLTFSV
jgi:hypothetical protein